MSWSLSINSRIITQNMSLYDHVIHDCALYKKCVCVCVCACVIASFSLVSWLCSSSWCMRGSTSFGLQEEPGWYQHTACTNEMNTLLRTHTSLKQAPPNTSLLFLESRNILSVHLVRSFVALISSWFGSWLYDGCQCSNRMKFKVLFLRSLIPLVHCFAKKISHAQNVEYDNQAKLWVPPSTYPLFL